MSADLYRRIQVRVFSLFEAGIIGGYQYEDILTIIREEINNDR